MSIPLVLFHFLGIIILLFIFWRRLREDYNSDFIFNTAFYGLILLFAGLAISQAVAGRFWFWFSFWGYAVGIVIGIIRYEMRIFEVIEASVISILPWFGLVFFSDYLLISRAIVSLLAVVVVAILGIVFYLIDKHYKKISWYKSGKIGFSGMSLLGIMFMVRGVVAYFTDSMLSFSGSNEVLMSATVAFIAFLTLYNLSKSTK